MFRLVPGGFFTHQIFNTMKERDLLRFEGPLGTFFLRQDSDRPVILMAGGTGFAPIKAIIEQAIERNIERPMHLFWGVRSEADLYMDDLARRWSDQHPHILYTPVLSEAGPEPVRVTQARNTGWVHDAVDRALPGSVPARGLYVRPAAHDRRRLLSFRGKGFARGRTCFSILSSLPPMCREPDASGRLEK